MKNILFLFSFLLLASCTKSVEITVENALDFDRNGEIVEITTAGLPVDLANKTYVLKDAQGQGIGYQILSDRQTLIFQANVPANASVTYTLKEGKPALVEKRTHARLVPERFDDWAFENDFAAYRMYGAALEKQPNQHPSNGVDIWMKYKDTPVMDSIYAARDSKSYHEDNGLGGFDCYDVGYTLGAGGINPYLDGKIWMGDGFDHSRIVESGALRSVFTLEYDTLLVNGNNYAETYTVTVDAGSPLLKAAVTFKGLEQPMQLAAGIYMHGDSVNTIYDSENKLLTFTKNAVTNKRVPQKQTFISVYLPAASGAPFVLDKQFAIASDYKVGDELTYYFGGVWSGWKFTTEQEWQSALAQWVQAKQNPLKVNVITK
ncbi:MAG: DUF4861 domain-containing protein [Dysgonamonadaceae bacterium]|nr:DUF4861 domain-containing protein [Dysgonamonadaceae bacterium]